ncbi:MAG: isoprenylcysteine carboxylmethyltransferase family protein [Saprospiraceae bacterium]
MPSKQDIIYVGLQFVLLVALFINPFGNAEMIHPWTGLMGFIICGIAIVFGLVALVQLGTNLTPWPSPKTNSSLVTTGTFGWARHPIYASLIWFAVGLSLGYMSLWRFVVTALLILLFIKKSTFEESMLHERFEAYAAYAKRVKRFGSIAIPKLW